MLLDPLRLRAGLRSAPVVLAALLAACSSGGDDGSAGPGGSPQPIDLASLSGVVVDLAGVPLVGAEVALGGLVVETNADGAFVMGFPEALPSAQLVLTVDGGPAEGPGQSYGVEPFGFTVDPADDRPTAPHTLVMPNRKAADGANATLTISGAGIVQTGVILNGPGGDQSLVIPAGTTVTIDGQPAPTGLEVSIVRVPGEELPHPLPPALAPAGFVAIGPTEARFDPIGGLPGLSAVLPNTLGYPLGQQVDIWSWDNEVLGWVNRTLQTGQKGEVINVPGGGTGIEVSGAVVEGGLYTGALIANNGYSTTITGRLIDTDGSPIRDATVATETGQVALTDGDGKFAVEGVTAFDYVAALTGGGSAVPTSVTYRFSTAAEDGAIVLAKASIPSIGIVPGGTTSLGDTQIDIPDVGALVGVLTGEPEVDGTPVTLVGPGGQQLLTPGVGNQFFVLGLEPGFYTASIPFTAGGSPVYASTDIAVGETHAVTLSPEGGTGTGNVSIVVGVEDGSSASPLVPAVGAQVLLFGSDEGSSQGVLRTTDAFGNTSFQGVDGPYTVTAETLVTIDGEVVRVSATVAGASPAGAPLVLALDGSHPLAANATLEGTIANLPGLGAAESFELLVVARGDVAGARFAETTPVNTASGDYSLAVPAGALLDVALLRVSSSPPGSDTTLAAVTPFTQPAGPLVAGGSAVFDVAATDAPSIAFDQFLDLDLAVGGGGIGGIGALATVELDLTLPGATGPDNTVRLPLPLGIIDGDGGDVELPDVDALVAAGWQLTLRAALGAEQAAAGDRAVATAPLLASATDLTLTVDAPPQIDDPQDGATYSAADLAAFALDVDLGEAAASDGLVRLRFEATGAELALGIERSIWTLWAPADALPAALPKLPMPAWVAGSTVAIEAEALRSLDAPLSLDVFATQAPLLGLVNLAATDTLARGRSAPTTVTVD